MQVTDMIPDQGQGGGQAVEDAGALAVCFANLKSKDHVAERLQAFQDIRKNRAASLQVLSNAGQDESEKIKAEAQKYIDGPVPCKSRIPWQDQKLLSEYCARFTDSVDFFCQPVQRNFTCTTSVMM